MGTARPPVLALDIGGTKLAVGVVTGDGAVHGLLIEPTVRDDGPEVVISRLMDLARRSLTAAVQEGLEQTPVAIGISCGGPLDAAAGILLCPPHLPGWINIPIVEIASQSLNLPAYLENDATAAALAEFRYGRGRGTNTMLYLTVSTGIGGGAVINGQLHRGAAGNGGEFGHVTVHFDGRKCTCARRGCLEAYASGTAIAEQAAEEIATGATSSLEQLAKITAADVSAAALAGDEVAATVWNRATTALGSAITDLVNVFEPDLVVLGGGVTRSGAQLLEPVQRAVATGAMGPAARVSRVELAELGDVVGVVGGGAIAHEQIKEPAGA